LGLIFSKQKFLWGLGAIFISLIILLPVILGRLALPRGTIEMSAFGEGGRHPTFSNEQVYYGSLIGSTVKEIRKLKLSRQYFFGRGGIVGEKREDRDKVTPLVLLSFLSILILRKENFRLDGVVYGLALSSAILFLVAWTFFPALYFPGKHNVGVTLFLILFAAMGLESSMSVLPSLKTKEIIKIGIFFLIICSFYPSFLFSKDVFLGTLGGSLSLLVLSLFFKRATKGFAYYNTVLVISVVLIGTWLTFFKALGVIDPTDAQRNLYRYISTLPKSSLIAGHPKDNNLNNIPFYAKRAVFLNTELFGSLTTGGLDRDLEKRAFENLDAYYSDSWKGVLSFCRKYGVTHLLIDKSHFPDVKLFYKPINNRVEKTIKSREKFVLNKLPSNIFSLYDNGIGVVNVSALDSYNSDNK